MFLRQERLEMDDFERNIFFVLKEKIQILKKSIRKNGWHIISFQNILSIFFILKKNVTFLEDRD